MNYRHAYHAGNFADVLKHAVLALTIEHLKQKPAAFRVIDTHAGIGLYDLDSVAAGKTLEWRDGIGRICGDAAEPLPTGIRAILAPYLEAVSAENAAGAIRVYPGSPRIAQHLIRAGDRLILNELHPEDAQTLAHLFKRDRRVKVLSLDGWQAAKSLLPPPERRGLVLIDPPYEARDELQRLVTSLSEATRRFATGTFLLWYPIKDLAPVEAFYDGVRALGLAKTLRIELTIRAPAAADRLNGCGLLVVNPPWTLEAKLRELLPFLAVRLAQGTGGGWRLETLSPATAPSR